MHGRHGRNDGVDACEQGQYPRDHRAVLSRDNPCDIGETPAERQRTADDDPQGQRGAIPIYVLTALSGAVTGFVFAGQFTLAGVTYAALVLGGVLGWLVRGPVG
ncbi:hypothetical protein EFQ99_05900 [Rhizobium vallis]|uniref:Uncharacterized protein n=1 Tax=Rhizobium vallis TaxID=634290 RepID=A0A3S0QWS8_9HYPH|nr:hypothetical protein [Rhizobium vallis]RUM25832.1 hypothetical protein EFQ99_05900 [Rhizobium vallis]